MTDCDLVARAKAGDRAAVNAILREATPDIRRLVRVVLLSRGAPLSLLDDAVSEALVVAWKAIGNWNPAVGLARFARVAIRGVAHEIATDATRDKGEALHDRLPAPEADLDMALDAAAMLRRIRPQRARIMWQVACGDEYSEVGEDMGCSKQYVGAEHKRAVDSLRRLYRKAA